MLQPKIGGFGGDQEELLHVTPAPYAMKIMNKNTAVDARILSYLP